MAGTELFGKEEQKEVQDVMETGILFRYNHDEQRNNIWKSKTFEKEFSDYNKVKHSHFCASGTAADVLSLVSCGVGTGDEVIMSPYSFIAPIEAVLTVGGIPVFGEIDETLCLSPEGIKAAITPRTKAVLLVHVFGSIAKIDEIKQVCDENNIILIEDAAPALGASLNGKAAGTFGKIGCFSFDFFKIITAGEGGAIITNDDDVYENAHMFSDHGHDHIGDNRGAEKHPILGFNFRNSELHAAIGLAQLRKLDHIIEKQKKNQKFLKQIIEKYPEVTLRTVPGGDEGDSATFLSFFLPTEEQSQKVIKEFENQNVEGYAYWYENNFHFLRNWEHLQNLKSIYKLPISTFNDVPDYTKVNLPKTEDIMKRLVMLQIMVNWSDEELSTKAEKIDTALKIALK